MLSSKPLASLSSGLLARKGAAKPAMRPQGFPGINHPAAAADDLGWNDMGQDEAAAPAPAPLPPVILQREALAAELAPASAAAELVAEAEELAVAPLPVDPTPVQLARVPRARAGEGGKAAFTLRLDAERHLKLRLACAADHRSAQALVTEALDRLLDTKPELLALMRQLPPTTQR